MPDHSTAQRCKRYRKKRQEECQEKDVLLKHHKCMVKKATDSIANEECLRKERERKKGYCERKKAKASKKLSNSGSQNSPSSTSTPKSNS